MTSLFLLMIVADVDRLGSPDFPTRDNAETRLSWCGLLAVPFVAGVGRESDNPEVRDRCRRLLTPWRSLAADLDAARLLCDPWPAALPDLVAAFNDDHQRRRLHRLAVAGGCGEDDTRRLHPDADVWCWFQSFAPQAVFMAALERCKRKLGHGPGWPFN